MGRTSIKVTTHSSSKSLDFLCKYFMLPLLEFFGYEIKFQTIQEVTRRGRHRFTLKMLLRSSAAVVSYWRKGKLNKKNLCTPSNAKNIGAIAKKNLYKLGKIFSKKNSCPF